MKDKTTLKRELSLKKQVIGAAEDLLLIADDLEHLTEWLRTGNRPKSLAYTDDGVDTPESLAADILWRVEYIQKKLTEITGTNQNESCFDQNSR